MTSKAEYSGFFLFGYLTGPAQVADNILFNTNRSANFQWGPGFGNRFALAIVNEIDSGGATIDRLGLKLHWTMRAQRYQGYNDTDLWSDTPPTFNFASYVFNGMENHFAPSESVGSPRETTEFLTYATIDIPVDATIEGHASRRSRHFIYNGVAQGDLLNVSLLIDISAGAIAADDRISIFAAEGHQAQ